MNYQDDTLRYGTEWAFHSEHAKMATDVFDSSPTESTCDARSGAVAEELHEIQERYYQLHHDHELLRSSFDSMMADFADLEEKYKVERERSQAFHVSSPTAPFLKLKHLQISVLAWLVPASVC
jgi:hypothetical protein